MGIVPGCVDGVDDQHGRVRRRHQIGQRQNDGRDIEEQSMETLHGRCVWRALARRLGSTGPSLTKIRYFVKQSRPIYGCAKNGHDQVPTVRLMVGP